MSVGKTALKVAGITVGTAAGIAGTAYLAQRALARSLDRRPDPDEGLLEALEFDEARRLPTHDGGSIHTVSRGDVGLPAFVFAHGVTLSSRVWVKQFARLPAHGVRVIAFDSRGHGDSRCGDGGHSVENLGHDFRTVLEELDLTDTIVVGHSMGGMAAMELAIRHADVVRQRVAGLVLLSTTARTQLSGSRWLRGATERVSGRFTLGSVMSRHDVGTLFARIGFGREPLASHDEHTRQMLASCDAETSREAVNALFGFDVVAELPLIDAPSLVIGGTNDILTTPGEVRRIAEGIRGARLAMVERAGHMIMLERSEELHELLLGFAREVGIDPLTEHGRAASA